MDACARSLQAPMARSLLAEMPVKTVACYNTLIKVLGRLQRIGEAQDALREMRGQSIAPDNVTFGCLINAHGMVYESEAVLRILDTDMPAAGLSPNVVAYGAAMAACARAGDRPRTAELLARMVASSVQPDRAHLTSMIVACARSKDEAGAREAWEDMRRRGVEPDIISYTALLACLRARGEGLPAAEALLGEMRQASIAPDGFVYNEMIRLALESGSQARCRELLAEMDAGGVAQNRVTQLYVRRLQEAEEADDGRKLPAGWHETLDPGSGRHYYWAEADPAGTTTWERPSGPAL